MSDRPYKSLRTLANRLRDDLNNPTKPTHLVLLYAYNRTGKTRLSMEFKDAGKRKKKGNADTLYFNAYTEDLLGLPRFRGQVVRSHAMTLRLSIDDQPDQIKTPVHGAAKARGC